MTTEGKTLLVSLLLHLLCVGGALSFAAVSPARQQPIPVDFTVNQAAVAGAAKPGDNTARPLRSAPAQPRKQTKVAAPQPVKTAPAQVKQIAPETVLSNSQDAAPIVTDTPAVQQGAATTQTAQATSASGKTDGKGAGASNGSGENGQHAGSGSTGDTSNTLRTRYLREHFSYIRDAVAGNLRYPNRARRMGWSGKVVVEFVVLETGGVDKIRIAKSSGIPLLDSDAQETVRRSAPFPKPPVSARLIIPMEYVLE